MYVQYSVHNAAASVQKLWKYIKDVSNIYMYSFSEIISESKRGCVDNFSGTTPSGFWPQNLRSGPYVQVFVFNSHLL